MRFIGPNHGSEVLRKRLQTIDASVMEDQDAGNAFAINTVFGEIDRDYDTPSVPNARSKGAFRILVEDHDELVRWDVPGQIASLRQEVAALRARPFV